MKIFVYIGCQNVLKRTDGHMNWVPIVSYPDLSLRRVCREKRLPRSRGVRGRNLTKPVLLSVTTLGGPAGGRRPGDIRLGTQCAPAPGLQRRVRESGRVKEKGVKFRVCRQGEFCFACGFVVKKKFVLQVSGPRSRRSGPRACGRSGERGASGRREGRGAGRRWRARTVGAAGASAGRGRAGRGRGGGREGRGGAAQVRPRPAGPQRRDPPSRRGLSRHPTAPRTRAGRYLHLLRKVRHPLYP